MTTSFLRITILTFLLSISIIIYPIILPRKEMISTLHPVHSSDGGQSISLKSQFLKFKLEGSFESANWSLYKHDVLKNESRLIIESSPYLGSVILKLDSSFYTIVVSFISNEPITMTTSQYGIPERNILSSIFFIGISVFFILVHLFKDRNILTKQ